MATVYRADTIGSLLRPPYLKLAREQFEAGQLEPAAYKEIEDRAVDQAIAMQEGVGLDVVTDGELRRHTFIDQLTEQVFGLSPDTGDSGHIPVPFHDEAGQLKSVFTIPLSVTDKLQRRRMMTTEEFAYARARARRPVKVTLPSPLMLFLVWSPQRSRDAYPDPFEMFADGLRLMKEEAEELARMGCRYIQVDAPDFGQLVDPAQRDAWEAAGISVDRVFSEGADMLNELAGVAGVSFGLHLCGEGSATSRTTRRWCSAWSRPSSTGWSRPSSWPPGSARRAASSRWTSSRCRRSAGSPRPDRATRSARTPRRTSCAWSARSPTASGGRADSRWTSSRCRRSAGSPRPDRATRSARTPRRTSCAWSARSRTAFWG